MAAVSPESGVDAVVRRVLQKVSEQQLLTSPHIALVQEAASPPAPVDARLRSRAAAHAAEQEEVPLVTMASSRQEDPEGFWSASAMAAGQW